MLRMIDTMETMVHARIFSSMDLKSDFWQVKMAEESHPYTAFTVGSLGVYEFLRMPFSLCNAPVTFQRLMQNCLSKLNLTYALIYLDGVVVFADTKAEHLKRLCTIFEQFHKHELKLKPTKCDFFKSEITYLGTPSVSKRNETRHRQLEGNCRDGTAYYGDGDPAIPRGSRG